MSRFFLLVLLIFFTFSHAKESLFELGIGVGSLVYPNYMGSKSTQSYTLPYPYMRYKSDYFNIDKDGISGKIFDIKDLKLDLSLGGSLPASSENSKVREGMPDLHFIFEIGPKIIYTIFSHGKASLFFELPIRAAFSTDLHSIAAQGLISTPEFKYELNYGIMEFTIRSGVMYADAQYHSYFYEVAKEYETPTRRTYSALGGYSALKNRLGITFRKDNWWGGGYISHYQLDGAIYEDSPLVETKSATYFGATLAYIFYSTRR